MVFSSIPAYLDPSNWHHQQQNHQIIGSSGASASTNPHPLLAPPQPLQPHGSGGGAGSIRPGSMSERARLANIPMPETALKCPRCESTNTKFCYFNNYSLSQPRHFCKTCRRYWTRGGALRNVPVGGGCRRNKRSKSGSRATTSSPASSDRQGNPNPSSSTGAISAPPQLPPHRFVSPLSQLSDGYVGGEYSGMTALTAGSNEMSFDTWRMQQYQQFPFLGGLDSSAAAGMYFHPGGEVGFMGGGGGGETSGNDMRPKLTNSILTQMAAVKTEDRNPERQLLGGGVAGNEQWNPLSVNWTELSSFSSSTTNHPL